MIRLVALCASGVVLAGCNAGSGVGMGGGLVERSSPAPAVPRGRTISYRTASFTDPTLDVSPDGQRLYFSAMGEIYVVPITGGLAEPLPLGGGWKFRPAISPDGRSIAFLSDLGAGISAWRRPLSMDRPATGEALPGYEATTLAWVDSASLASTGGGTRDFSGFGLAIDYEGEHGHAHRAASATAQPAAAAMSADQQGNVFLHRGGIVRLNASTGLQDRVVVPRVANTLVGQPRVTSDGAWLGFVRMSGGTAQLLLKNVASGELRETGCRLNSWFPPWNSSGGPEPAYAFIPDQQAVVLERDGVFLRCTFEGVETPIPVEADVRVDLAPRIRPSRAGESSAPGVLLNLASTADGRRIAFSDAGRLWVHDRSSGQTRRISNSDAHERMPAFSPDGRRLAYVERLQDESSTLRVLDLESGASTLLLHSQGVLENPAWSPDGRRIAFLEAPLFELRRFGEFESTGRFEATLRWLGLDGSAGVVGQVQKGEQSFPTIAWDRSGSAIFYTKLEENLTLMSHRLDGEPQPLLAADRRVWDLRVSPSGRFVALRTRDGVYVTPILLSSGTPPTFSWSEVRSMKRLWTGGGDHLQWLADDSLIWTVQHTLMHASLDEEPREIADLSRPPEAAAEPERHAYVGATVISMDQAGTIEDAVILTRGRALEYVGARAGAPDLTGIETTDLSGKWVVPGFIDVHGHKPISTQMAEINLPVTQPNLAEVGFGVTTLFDPAEMSVVESAAAWAASQRDEFLGPTLYGSGPPVLGQEGTTIWHTDVESYEHALELATDLAGRGGLMIKTYLQPTRRQRQWLAQAALATGLGVTAHEDQTPHVTLPLIFDGYTAIEHAVSYDGPLREDIKQFLIESQTSLTPTLAMGGVRRNEGVAFLMSGASEPSSPDPRRDCLIDPALLSFSASGPPDPDRLRDSGIGIFAADYAELLNRGARVTIGGHGDAPGLDFHWELALLAMGGATPMNLLRAATVNGAEKLGLESRIGSLAQGKDADFVVLNANPLDDIRNARNIDSVVRRGRAVTWPAGPAPQSWKSARSWDDCQSWNFGLGGAEAPFLN